MLDHFGIVVTDLAKSIAFYENSLRPLGLKITERHDYGAVIFAKCEEKEFPFIWIGTARPSFWTDKNVPGNSPAHFCFKAASSEAVDLFYEAAMEFGGKDNGKPGQRGSHFYAAYVIDPDGNNIEAGYRDQK